MSHTFIIAEAGSCHDNSYEKAMSLIDEAKHVGANACKFQYWSSAERLAARRHAKDYLDVYRHYQLPKPWLGALANQCKALGIEFMATVYLPEDVATIAPFVKRFKVASFEAQDTTLLRDMASYHKPILVSTGMLTERELTTLSRSSADVRILHCVSAYPSALEDLNLRAIRHSVGAGYSDHSRHPIAGALAVACGAEVIEAHLRLDETSPKNPDFVAAMAPGAFATYVRNIRDAELMLGDSVKRVQAGEHTMLKYRVMA